MILFDLLTNGLQCPLKVQALFPGALHTWLLRSLHSTYFLVGTVRFIQKLDARKFYKDGINNILVALIQTHIEVKSTPFLLDQWSFWQRRWRRDPQTVLSILFWSSRTAVHAHGLIQRCTTHQLWSKTFGDGKDKKNCLKLIWGFYNFVLVCRY